MKKRQEPTTMINLDTFAGGAFKEKVNEAISQVAENIQNPNTDATTKRKITITMTLAPNKSRQMVNTQIAVTVKLASTEAIDTQMLMGTDMRTGQVEIREYDGNIPGQMAFSDMVREAEGKPEPDGTPEQEPAQVPSGKPLDLKNRGRNQQDEGPVPGRDFDEETGEIYGKVVNMKAAEA
ncbi:MAG: replication protein [Lachnospiraceae bacterium]|nr:replication protein [Lachnospiraceae bacterium]